MRFKKSVLTGVIALGTLIGAGAVSAAPYTVAGNDTMWTISKKHGISLYTLIHANPQVSNPNIIWPGMRLNIPSTVSGSGSSVKQGTGSATTTSTFASQVVAAVNQERAKAGLKTLASDSSLSSMADLRFSV
jgi:spore coat assembly protein SafA